MDRGLLLGRLDSWIRWRFKSDLSAIVEPLAVPLPLQRWVTVLTVWRFAQLKHGRHNLCGLQVGRLDVQGGEYRVLQWEEATGRRGDGTYSCDVTGRWSMIRGYNL